MDVTLAVQKLFLLTLARGSAAKCLLLPAACSWCFEGTQKLWKLELYVFQSSTALSGP